MSGEKIARPSVRTVLKDGLLHLHIGKQYAGYVVTPIAVEEHGDEMIIRLKILFRRKLAESTAQQ